MSPQSRTGLAIILISFLFVVTLGYLYFKIPPKTVPNLGCTLEAMICPDGSSVSRSGPKCEFTPCPKTAIISPLPSLTLEWKRYSSKEWKFSIKYPQNWKVSFFKKPEVDLLPPGSEDLSAGGVNVSLEMNNLLPVVPKTFVNYSPIDSKTFDGASWAIKNNDTGEITFWKNSIQVYSQVKFTKDFNDLVYQQIMASFKFADSDSLDKTNQALGYLKKAYQKENSKYIDIDYVDWISDSTTPNNFRINNVNPLIRTFKVSHSADIYLIDWTDQGMINPKISFPELIDTINNTSANYTLGPGPKLFDVKFGSDNIVNEIKLRYIP